MKKLLMLLLLMAGVEFMLPLQAKTEHILPMPQKVVAGSGSLSFTTGATVKVTGVESSSALVRFFQEFGISQVQFDASTTKVQGDVVVKRVVSIPGAHDYTLYGYDNEAYMLRVTPQRIEIDVVSDLGLVRAAQTLTQLAEGYDQKGLHLECVTITDWPAFKLRGYMHDIGRSFVSVDMIKRHIDLLSRFKVNTFHWHFTENQGFRFEVKAYPKLNQAAYMTRDAGQFYSQKDCRAIEDYAFERGIIVIPEIDMPGHSEAFERAMGCTMQSYEGKQILKKVLDEVGQTFTRAPYIHIGADEKNTSATYVNEMIDYVKDVVGRRCVVWNPMSGVNANSTHADMFQLWSTAGTAVEGKPNIDCRYNYTNHFDVFADLVGIYKSNIYYRQQGDATVAGTISAMWNDRRLENEHQIVAQNNFYANVIASASRAWQGGGEQYIDKSNRGGKIGGGVMLPNDGKEFDDFKNWEDRFLFHKAHSLAKVAQDIPYVKQTNVRWRITEPFNNGGNVNAVFPPEQMMTQKAPLPAEFTHNGQTYGTGIATGAGIYLRHTWKEGTISAYYDHPGFNQTAYAWTYVYSPVAQTVGALIEFQNYSRSELDAVPGKGKWDLMGSKIWINGKAVEAPGYENFGVALTSKEVTQKNENFPARKPVRVQLNAGWNKVFLKLPYIDTNKGYRLQKWMFTCVFTDTDGRAAVDNLIYSPNQSLDEGAEQVSGKIAEIRTHRNAVVKDQPGYYAPALAAELDAAVQEVEATLNQSMTLQERQAQVKKLDEALAKFDAACQKAGIQMPQSSTTESIYYTMCTPLRNNFYAISCGANSEMAGVTDPSEAACWKFVKRPDGDLDIVNLDGSFVSPQSGEGTALRTVSTSPSRGWQLSQADALGYFIITSGTVQFNQTVDIENSVGKKIFNWGGGNNKSDDGCKYAIHTVSGNEPEASPEMPVAGKLYYMANKHMAGNQYFYDKNGRVGFSGQKMAQVTSYAWQCVDAGNGRFYFRNLGSKRYLAWKTVSASPCRWALSTAKEGTSRVTNDGCVSMQAIDEKGSNFMVCKQGDFDQANRAGFYDETYSSDFFFELCENKDWEELMPDGSEVCLYSTPGPGGKPYRIPAIAQAKNGDLFGIADFRPCGKDIGFGEVDVMCRISRDNGKTWNKAFKIADGMGDDNGGEVWLTGFGDAAVVADAEQNELLVMMVCGKTVCHDGNYIPGSPYSNPNRVARVRATYNESTEKWIFSEPKEVTESIYSLFVHNGEATVKSLFIGSGKICQSRKVKVGKYYRLYCAMWTKNEGNRVIYSDDFGENWHILGTVYDRPARYGDEPKCEELPDGSVVLSSRSRGRIFNIFQFTDPVKATGRWLGEEDSSLKINGIKVGNTTNGEILLVKAVRKGDGAKVNLALQSVPFGNDRSNVGFYFKEITETECGSVTHLASNWTKGLQVSHTYSAYSTMILQDNHKIGFYYEEAPGEYSLIYKPLTVENITEGAYALDTEDEQTGIDILRPAIVGNGAIYDLTGRQVVCPDKGIYICNGKKVMIM